MLLGAAAAIGLCFAQRPDQGARLPMNVAALLGRMTLEEKVAMLAGSGWMESTPIPRLGIPAIKMADGPMGVRNWTGSSAVTNAANTTVVTATAFPAGIAMASTFDTDLVRRQGVAIGQQVKAYGRDMILGPTVNIARIPQWGRNFEGYGEDPYLASRMAVAYIDGVQSERVIATVKHFAANNQEFERHRVDVLADERTLSEIYLPAFRAAVQEGGAWSVMSAYNRLNGQYCAENSVMLRDVLKKSWGFRGFVISDWGSTYSTAPTVNAGMDLEMPGGAAMRAWFARPETQREGNGAGWLTPAKILEAVKDGKISVATIDDNVSRILRAMAWAGLLDHPHTAGGEVDTPDQKAVALAGATEGIVLLKNAGNVLPIDPAKVHSIAVIGPNAATARTGGGGSSLVRPKFAVAPIVKIRQRAGSDVRVDILPGDDRAASVALAAKSDLAILMVGFEPTLEHEGADRNGLSLPPGQDDLIQAVADANPRTVVVINSGGPVEMEKWLAKTPAVLEAWYGGQESAQALAAILFGDANPSGKLPVTFPRSWKDEPAYGHYPGENLRVNYAEGIYVGYRHFDTRGVEPLFPFGYGLSYTTFEYPDSRASGDRFHATVQVQVRNTGTRAGAEVVQLYVHPAKAPVDRPEQELKAFARVMLQPGDSQMVRLQLDRGSFAYYDPKEHDWMAVPGDYELRIGPSSRDIRQRINLKIAP